MPNTLSRSKLFTVFNSASLKTALQYLFYCDFYPVHLSSTSSSSLPCSSLTAPNCSEKKTICQYADNANLYSYCNPVYRSCWAYLSLYFHNLGFFYFLSIIYFHRKITKILTQHININRNMIFIPTNNDFL